MFSCFSLNVYLPQNIDMSLSQVQWHWYSQNLEKQSGSTLTKNKNITKIKFAYRVSKNILYRVSEKY